MTRALSLAALWLALAPIGRAVTLQPADSLVLFCFAPPGLEVDPFNSNRAFLACSDTVPGSFGITIQPGVSLGFVGINYFLPGNLNCTESSPATFGFIGRVYLEPSVQRGWLTTSNCELVVPFSTTTGGDGSLLYQGQSRRSIPTLRTVTGSFTTYTHAGAGSEISSFATNFTSDIVRVGNRLLVATSNFCLVRRNPVQLCTLGPSPILNPGTVLVFDIDDSGPTPTVVPANPPYLITSDPNPTALTVLPDGLVAVTNTGILDAGFPPLVIGPGSIDIIDPLAGTLLGSVPLTSNPGGRTLAVDPSGSVAVAGSHTQRQLYAIDIRGLALLPRPDLDPTLQRPSCNEGTGAEAGGLPCLHERVIDVIALPPPPGQSGTAGFVPQVRFGASGDFVVATSLNDGGLGVVAFDPRHLDRPHPLLPSRFGAPETLAATPPSGGFGVECCPGPMILHASSAGGVNGTDVLWATRGPDGTIGRGRLLGSLPVAGGDFDGDGTEDALDDCPVFANVQADSPLLRFANQSMP